MIIAKPIRVLASVVVAGAAAGASCVIFAKSIGAWAILASAIIYVLGYFLAEWIVNRVDFWLRDVTRDPLWMAQLEGRRKASAQSDRPKV